MFVRTSVELKIKVRRNLWSLYGSVEQWALSGNFWRFLRTFKNCKIMYFHNDKQWIWLGYSRISKMSLKTQKHREIKVILPIFQFFFIVGTSLSTSFKLFLGVAPRNHRMQQILFYTESPHQPDLKSSSIYIWVDINSLGSSVFSQHVRGSKVLTTVWESKMPASSEYHTENTPSNLGQLILQCLFV